MEEKKLTVVKNDEKIDLKKENEQLKGYVNQLMQQRNQLMQQLNGIQNVLNKLPWLFKVIEFKDMFESAFVEECVNEITVIMTPPVEDNETPETENPSKE